MKKKHFLISFLLLLVLGFSINFITIKADSGWDSDYDSGGSWDSDYDSGGSWDSSSSHSSSSSDADGLKFIFIVIFMIIGIIRSSKNKKKITYHNNVTYSKETISEKIIKKSISDFNENDFLNKAYNSFIDIQNAWSEFDYDLLQKLLSDELFNTYKSQLKTLNIKKQKNVMEGFERNWIGITNFNHNDGKSTIVVTLDVSFYDYVIDKDKNVVRGKDNIKINNVYELTFISNKKTENKVDKKCPNCKAPLEDNVSNVCPYCKSKIVHENYDWVMSKKQIKGK